jgi:hypothetical protein
MSSRKSPPERGSPILWPLMRLSCTAVCPKGRGNFKASKSGWLAKYSFFKCAIWSHAALTPRLLR